MEQMTSLFSRNSSEESAEARLPARSDEAFITCTSGVSRGRNSDASGRYPRTESHRRAAPVSVADTSRTVCESDSTAAIWALCDSCKPKAATRPQLRDSASSMRRNSGASRKTVRMGCCIGSLFPLLSSFFFLG
ncbi:unknown [Clostridium sp. CAG:1024]|nr:unknown [Clostridium sp. CAG:1024]